MRGWLTFFLIAAFATALCLTGCSLLKPSVGTPRTFVLTPTSVQSASAPETPRKIVVGIKPVKTAGYLSSKSMVMRKGANEIVYLDSAAWAERLDDAVLRVLGADLAALIPTDQVRLSSWGHEAVTVEIELNVEQFDVDAHGEGVLKAWWRVLSPGGEKVLDAGRFSATKNGRPPDADPQGAASLMSGLVGELAQTLAKASR